jgi:uroporphyrinogen-III decarboxylase
MAEEPEVVKELLNYMADVYVPIIEKTLQYYKPDLVYMADDTAAERSPFISVEMYRDILKPIYKRLAGPANDRGIPIEFHNCGHSEAFVPDMIDLGVKVWDPAQPSNDINGIKKKYPGKIAMAGGFDFKPPKGWPNVNEEEIRQQARDVIDKNAPGGRATSPLNRVT